LMPSAAKKCLSQGAIRGASTPTHTDDKAAQGTSPRQLLLVG
jgi:hypothetical protein